MNAASGAAGSFEEETYNTRKSPSLLDRKVTSLPSDHLEEERKEISINV